MGVWYSYYTVIGLEVKVKPVVRDKVRQPGCDHPHEDWYAEKGVKNCPKCGSPLWVKTNVILSNPWQEINEITEELDLPEIAGYDTFVSTWEDVMTIGYGVTMDRDDAGTSRHLPSPTDEVMATIRANIIEYLNEIAPYIEEYNPNDTGILVGVEAR